MLEVLDGDRERAARVACRGESASLSPATSCIFRKSVTACSKAVATPQTLDHVPFRGVQLGDHKERVGRDLENLDKVDPPVHELQALRHLLEVPRVRERLREQNVRGTRNQSYFLVRLDEAKRREPQVRLAEVSDVQKKLRQLRDELGQSWLPSGSTSARTCR